MPDIPILSVVNVEAAIYRDDQYLMVIRGEGEDHAPGTLSLIGGTPDRTGDIDHILEETLRREIREEVCVEVAPDMEYVHSSAFMAGDVPVVDVVFLCRYESGEPRIGDHNEVAEIAWLSAQDIVSHPKAPPWTLRSIQRAEAVRLAAIRSAGAG
jgi:8-oxo-dGTP diphosphatase